VITPDQARDDGNAHCRHCHSQNKGAVETMTELTGSSNPWVWAEQVAAFQALRIAHEASTQGTRMAPLTRSKKG